jgi:hypothetical protein
MNDGTDQHHSYNEWLRLANAAVETEMAKRLLVGVVVTAEETEALTNWGLAGLGAFAVLLLANADKLAPLLDIEGLVSSVCWIVLAAAFGMAAKIRFQQCVTGSRVSETVGSGLLDALARYNETDRPKLMEYAKTMGLPEPAEPSMERAFTIAMSGQPWLAKLAGAWGARRARMAKYPELESNAIAARWGLSQKVYASLMVGLGGVAILNLLCFLARPQIFLWLLFWIFN